MEEVKVAFEMLMYSKNNPEKFKGSNELMAWSCGLFKLLGGGFCEIINILIILQSESITDVIKDFIAFGIIADIDNIMAATLFSTDVEAVIEEAAITYPKSQRFTKNKHLISLWR
jgi:hypothetical protein